MWSCLKILLLAVAVSALSALQILDRLVQEASELVLDHMPAEAEPVTAWPTARRSARGM